MRKFCYLKIEDLKGEDERIFKPLEGREFEELVESVREFGILFPLIVKKDTDGKFTILSGWDRYRAAMIIGISEIPCMIEEDDNMAVGAIFDTNLVKKEFSKKEKEYYRKIRAEKKEKMIEKTAREKLVPEIAKLLRGGSITLEIARVLSQYSKEQQEKLVNVFREYVDDEQVERLRKEAEKAKQEVHRLREVLSDREKSLREMREREDAAKELLREKLHQLEKAKENTDKEVRKEYEKEIRELQKNLQDLSKVIKEKNNEINEIHEAKEKAERMQKDRQTEVNVAGIKMKEFKETYRNVIHKFSNPDIIISRFNNIIAELDTLANHVIQLQWDEETANLVDKKAEEIINKVKKVAKDMRENVATEIEDIQMSSKL